MCTDTVTIISASRYFVTSYISSPPQWELLPERKKPAARVASTSVLLTGQQSQSYASTTALFSFCITLL